MASWRLQPPRYRHSTLKCYSEYMKVIIGLGNPEERFRQTRHNVGFLTLSRYAETKGIAFQQRDKFKACIAEYTVAREKVLLVKPTTYYNLVGESAHAISDFYKLDSSDVLVIHDDLALPFGTIRTREKGSDAGNNGIKSLNTHIGPDTARIRIGIANDLRLHIPDADFVLSKFTHDEQSLLVTLQPKIAELIDDFIRGQFVTTTHR